MAPPVSQLGNPPDVTALHVIKESDVINAQKDSREMVARNVPRGSRERIARNANLVTTMETSVVTTFYSHTSFQL